MIDAMIRNAQALLDLLVRLDIPPELVGYVLVGLLVSWAGTQYVKRRVAWWGKHALGLGFVLGFLPVFTLSWGHGWHGFWLAVATGASATGLYKLLVYCLAKRWAWVQRLSGDPR